jgi:hypothetical protein
MGYVSVLRLCIYVIFCSSITAVVMLRFVDELVLCFSAVCNCSECFCILGSGFI